MSKSLETQLRELPGVSVRGQWYVELAALIEHLKRAEADEKAEAPKAPKALESGERKA
jgi:hypothetical protein